MVSPPGCATPADHLARRDLLLENKVSHHDQADCPAALSEREHAGANEIRELLTLVGVEERVDLAKRFHQGVAEVLSRANARARHLRDLGLVEGRVRDRIGESSGATSMVDGRLRSFRLEIAQDPSELRHLAIVQIELVRQETQRATHAERAASKVSVARALAAEVGRETNLPIGIFTAGRTATVRTAAHRDAPRPRRTMGELPP